MDYSAKETMLMVDAISLYKIQKERSLSEKVAAGCIRKIIIKSYPFDLQANEALFLFHIIREMRDELFPEMVRRQMDLDFKASITNEMSDADIANLKSELKEDFLEYSKERRKEYTHIMYLLSINFPEWGAQYDPD